MLSTQVEALKLKPNTKYFYQWRYRQNDKTAPVRAACSVCALLPHGCCMHTRGSSEQRSNASGS
jgi:hypothetical protein